MGCVNKRAKEPFTTMIEQRSQKRRHRGRATGHARGSDIGWKRWLLAAGIAAAAAVGLLSVVLAFSPRAAEAVEKTLELPVVDKSIEHHGIDVYRRAEIEFTVGSRSGKFHVKAWHDNGLFEYQVTDLREGRDGVYRHSNRAGDHELQKWEAGEEVALDEAGRSAAQDFVSSRIYFPFLPLRLNDGNTWKEDQGIETWEGRRLHRVKVTFTEGTSSRSNDAYAYWFDPESARLEMFAYSFDGGLRFRPLNNHRRVGGILFHDQPNYAWDGSVEEAGLSVDSITPEFVEKEMELISTVVIEDIEVKALP